MVNFTYQPSQYYARTPVTNQVTTNFYNPGQGTPIGYGYNNISNDARYSGYNPNNPVPGTIGYSLPAQAYANYGINNLSNYGTQSLKTQLVNTAITAGVSGLISGLTGNGNNPSNGRLYGSGIAYGATSAQLLQPSSAGSNVAFQDDSEDRVIITDQSGIFIGQSDVFGPLSDFGGVLFPYTPTISVGHKASYDAQTLVHTNYVTPQYQHSSVDNISIVGMFTANYPAEAEYMVAMLHFFRSVTKMFYGNDQLAGTPPPVLYLDGYGKWTFDHIPVVITGFDYSLPNDVDYISCTVLGEKQKVPTTLTVNLSMLPTYSRNKISNEFSVVDFSQGSLLTSTSSGSGGSGGWI